MCIRDSLYTQSWGKAGAEIGLGVAQNIQQPYKSVVNELQALGFWEGKISRHLDHPLSKMQSVVDEFFNTNVHVNLKQLWEALQQPPYGLMPSPIGILIFAFLLRKYANGYYYSDGNNSFPLNPNKLAELIEQVMKCFRFSENYTIRKMSIEGERFCHIARDVFRLTQEQAAYPEEARKNIRRIVSESGYPLWTLMYYVQGTYSISSVSHVMEAVRELNEILTFTKDELEDREIKAVVDVVSPVRYDLSEIINRDRMQEGLRRFLEIHNPQPVSYTHLDVYKRQLLLLALWTQTQGVHSLLKPKLSNIKNMFLGTELYQKIREVADALCSKNIMYAISIGNDMEYMIPTSTIDQNKLNECRRDVYKRQMNVRLVVDVLTCMASRA